MNSWWERHPRAVDALAVLFWAALIGGSLLLSLLELRQEVERVAYERSRVLFNVVETTRLWNASHGRVYAPVTEKTPPNPYLESPDRDVEIGGVAFTMVNPAYMTRQISELVQSQQEFWFKITSLRPLNPGNAPDSWEHDILQRFETGQREALDLVTDDAGERRFRYMAALVVEPACISCHAAQGYQVGDVRGGLSVSLPATSVFNDFDVQRRQSLFLHGAAFVLLSLGTLAFLHRARRNWEALRAAKTEQEAMVAARTAELRAANQALEASNTELETFAYAVSHDLQEPLRMVSGYAGILRRRYDNTLDAEGQEYLDFMTDGAGRMRAMINDLLAYSRVDRQGRAPVPAPLNAVIDAALGNLHMALEEAGAEVSVQGTDIAVLGDGSQLARLFQNLVSNAIKYAHPDRPPRITITAHRDGATVVVRVGDNGMGIPVADRDRVFGLFQRLRRNQAEGTGMGLSLARRIVQAHGGTLTIDDPGSGDPGQGTVFRLTLPAAGAAGPAGTADPVTAAMH